MTDQPELPANIAPDAFAGTAEDYARYRPDSWNSRSCRLPR